ncbi:MAG: transposase [Chloroflexales bacterium]
MSRPTGLSQWQQTVSTQLPHLSKPQATVLALWSLGIILAQSCGLSSVAVILAALLDRTETTIREQLRDWCRDGAHKAGAKHGAKRRSLEITACFAPLLRWVVALHPADCRQLALAMDASTLGQRFTILSIHVVIRGCAIPVAWHIVEATRAGAWRPHWEALFRQLEGSVPSDWQVIVTADRGLYAKWLFHAITALGWHPLLRINRQGQYCPADSTVFRPLSQVLTTTGQRWAGAVRCFATKERQLTCTLLARWDKGYKDPWLIVTDVPAERADVAWYGLRAWIEASYKDAKRGGWHWEQTKMTHPRRAERLWLAMAVAMLWVISVGCQAEAMLPVPDLDALPVTHIARQKPQGRRPPRSVSCFRRGRLVIIAALCAGLPLPTGQLLPEPWPKSLDTHVERPSAYRPLSNAA